MLTEGKDIHLDPFYEPGSSPRKSCHRGKGKAGYLGAPGEGCDSPEILLNQTFDWIERNLKDKIDFIVWTGDSARHDNDERIPRTETQIEELNQAVVDKFMEVFGEKKDGGRNKPTIPIVPNIGNNDVMPHNIFEKGPNKCTRKLGRVWKPFIPEEQRHTFLQWGWFYTEVIPSKLAVVSLNTMYFYESNAAVDGCAARSEPGYHHFEWLRVQLQLMREREMKAILIGHVPPARSGKRQNWDESCWQKYTLWLHQYRDVVVGSMYGHMNLDHFIIQDSREAMLDAAADNLPSFSSDDEHDQNITTQSKFGYLSSLREEWARLPSPPSGVELGSDLEALKGRKKRKKKNKRKRFLKKIGGPYAERYSVSLVSPSVIPRYYPTIRVFEYNITGLEHAVTWADSGSHVSMDSERAQRETELNKKKLPRIPSPPSKSAPPGPAYSNQPLTLLNYIQYYANLTQIENRSKLDGELSALEYEVEYHTHQDDIYHMRDLTMPSFFDLATRIAGNSPAASSVDIEKKRKKKKKKGSKKDNKVWRAFLNRAFVGFLDDYELDGVE